MEPHQILTDALAELRVAPGDGDVIVALHDRGGPGPDGTIWGGEILAATGAGHFRRSGILFPVRVPGGAAMVRERWRMTCAWLAAATDEVLPPLPAALRGEVAGERWASVAEMVRTGLSSPLTTSAGLMIDALDSLLGAAATAPRGAQAIDDAPAYPMPLIEEGEAPLILDARATFRAALDDLEAGTAPAAVRMSFLAGLGEGTARAVSHVARRSGAGTAVLAGDVFAEPTLLAMTAARLEAGGMRVLASRRS